MGLREFFSRMSEKRKEEKEEFRRLEREERFKKLLEEKHKTPAQKEHEFYQREKQRENLKKLLIRERKIRQNKLNKLSSPYGHKVSLMKKNDLADRSIKWV